MRSFACVEQILRAVSEPSRQGSTRPYIHAYSLGITHTGTRNSNARQENEIKKERSDAEKKYLSKTFEEIAGMNFGD